MLNFIFSFLAAINANDSKHQMSFGFAFGAIIGLTPTASLHNLIVLLLAYLLNVNLSVMVVAGLLYKIIGIVISKYSHILGYYLLVTRHDLFDFWTTLYNLPIVPWTHFYNTVVLGSFVISLVLFFPNYLFFRSFLFLYRKYVRDRLAQLQLFKAISASSLYQTYLKFCRVKEGLS